MARNLKVGEWVGKINGRGEILQEGFITKNLGNGAWEIQMVRPKIKVDHATSSQLKRLDSSLNESQLHNLKELYINMAIDTKDWDWLNELVSGNLV